MLDLRLRSSRLLSAVLATVAGLSLLGCEALRREPGSVAGQPAAGGDDLQLRSFEQAWTRISETYPYPDFKGLDWEAVRDELRPKAAEARTAEELRPVLQEMFSRLGESHFGIIPGGAYDRLEELTEAVKRAGETESSDADAGETSADSEEAPAEPVADGLLGDSPFGDLGLELRVVDGEVLVSRVDADGPAAQGGVQTGWLLESIGKLETAPLVEAAAEATADGDRMANYGTHLALKGALQGRPGSRIRLGFVHGGGEQAEIELRRREPVGTVFSFGNFPETLVTFESETLPDTRVGYLRFNIFMFPVAPAFTQAVTGFVRDGVDGVILDLRGNPGGIGAMVMGMAGHFVAEQGLSLGEMKMRDTELRFVANPRADFQRFDGPVAVLVDELSASTSEVMASGMKHAASARVFGTTSAGMALPSIIESLPNGDRMQFATADLTAPDGQRLEGLGVEPDEEVRLSREALLEGEDPVIAAAVAWIESQGAGAS
jgi:carboxyl-terminal processing protease